MSWKIYALISVFLSMYVAYFLLAVLWKSGGV